MIRELLASEASQTERSHQPNLLKVAESLVGAFIHALVDHRHTIGSFAKSIFCEQSVGFLSLTTQPISISRAATSAEGERSQDLTSAVKT